MKRPQRQVTMLRTLVLCLCCCLLGMAMVPAGGEAWSDLMAILSGAAPGTALHTVTFRDAEGNELVTQIVRDGESAVEPVTPDVPGKKFMTWDSEPAGQSVTQVTRDTVFTAVYADMAKHTVTVRYVYDDDDRQIFPDTVYDYQVGQEVNLTIAAPSEDHYTWEPGTVEVRTDAIDRDYEYTVRYRGEEVEYTVRHLLQNADDDNYTAVETETLTGTFGRDTEAVAREYAGFTLSDDGVPVYPAATGAVVDIKYNRDKYILIFDSDGGTPVDGSAQRYGAAITLPTAEEVTRAGHTLNGWKNGDEVLGDTFIMPTEDTRLTARWTANETAEYTVVYWFQSQQDDKNAAGDKIRYDFVKSEKKTGKVGECPVDIDVNKSNAPAAENFVTFNEGNSDVTADGVGTREITADGKTVINVKFDRALCTFTFRAENKADEIRTGLYGQTWKEAGYDSWIGNETKYLWEGDEGCPGKWTFLIGFYNSKLTSADVTFKRINGSYKIIKQMIQNPDGKTWSVADSFRGGGGTFKLTDKFAPGFSVIGYSKTDGGKGTEIIYDPTASGIEFSTLYVYNKRNAFELSFGNCQPMTPSSVLYEDKLSNGKPEDSEVKVPEGVEPDYIFGGWYLDSTCTEPVNWKAKMPAANMQIYAGWNPPDYNVRYHSNFDEDAVLHTDAVTKYEAAPAYTDEPVRKDYTFAGWFTDPACTIGYVQGNAVIRDVDVYAGWAFDGEVTVTIHYTDDAGNKIAEDTVKRKKNREEFKVGAKAISGYKARLSSKTLKAEDGLEYTFVYTRAFSWTLTVEYRDAETGEELLPSESMVSSRQQEQVNHKPVEGYKLKNEPQLQVAAPGTDGFTTAVFLYEKEAEIPYAIEFSKQQEDGTFTEAAASLAYANRQGQTVTVDPADMPDLTRDNYRLGSEVSTTFITLMPGADNTLRLRYILTSGYTIHHYLDGTNVRVADDETGSMDILTTLTAKAGAALYDNYAQATFSRFDETGGSIVIGKKAKNNVINVYYKVPLVIRAEDAEKIYDEKALKQPKFTVEGLKNGDTKANFSLKMTPESTLTDVGIQDNEIDPESLRYRGSTRIPSYYDITFEKGVLEVRKETLSITGRDYTGAYDGEAHGSAARPGVVSDTTVYYSTDGGATWTEEVPTITEVGEKAVMVKAENPNYETVSDTYTLKVEPKEVTITADSLSKVYGDADPAFTGVVTGLVNADDLGDVTYHRGELDLGRENVGEAIAITASYTPNPNYAVTVTEGTLTIDRAPLTVTAASASKAFDGTALTEDAVHVTGLKGNDTVSAKTVTGTRTEVGSAVNRVSGITVTDGTADVTGNYSITYVNGTLEVTRAKLNLAVTPYSGVYDGAVHGAAAIPDVTEGTAVSYSTNGGKKWSNQAPTIAEAGTKTVLVKAENPNYETASATYTLQVNPKAVIITVDNATKVYGDADPVFTGTVSGLVNPDDLGTVTYARDSADATKKNVNDDISIRPKYKENPNYTVMVVPGKLTITKAALTITGADAVKAKDGKPLTSDNVTVEGLKENDKLSAVTLTGSRTNVGSSLNVPSDARIGKNGSATDNYDITYIPGTLTVTKAITTVKGKDYKGTYDGEAHGVAAVPGVTEGMTLYYSTDDGATWTATVPTITDVGLLTVTVKTDHPDYEIATDTYTLQVTPRNATIKVDNKTKEYGDSDPVFTGKVNGTAREGDLGTVTYARVAADAGRENIGDVIGITAVFAPNPNYNVKVTDGKLTVERVTLTITAGSAVKAYDGTALTADTYTAEGLKGNDRVTGITFGGSQTLVGSSDNKASGAGVERDGVDVTGNYKIIYKPGKLTVTDDCDIPMTLTHPAGEYNVGDVVTFTVSAINYYDKSQTISFGEIPDVRLAQDIFRRVRPGEEVKTTATYTIRMEDILAKGFTNTATVTIGNKTKASEDKVEVGDMVPKLTVTNVPSPGKNLKSGTMVYYTITVRNSGNVKVSGILAEAKMSGLVKTGDWSVFDLEPATRKELTAVYAVTQTNINDGEPITVTATAAGTGPEGDEAKHESPSTITFAARKPELTVSLTAKPDKGIEVGDKITYTVTVQNTGNVTITGITAEPLTAGMVKTGKWDSLDLEPSRKKRFTAEYTVTQADLDSGISLIVSAAAAGTDSAGQPVTGNGELEIPFATPKK